MALKVAVTGATGFAGQHVLRELLARGHEVRALVRDPRRLPAFPKVEAVPGDLRQPATLERLAAGADVLINLAGAIAARSRAEFQAVNVHGTSLLAEAAAAAGIKRIVHVSSLAAREPGLSGYGESKHEAEKIFAGKPGAVIVRPPAVYGPGDYGTFPLVSQLLKRVALIPSQRTARFSLIYVQDLAEIIADLAVDDRSGPVDVHDGRAGGYGWQDLAGIVHAQEGVPGRVVYLPRFLAKSAAIVATPLQLVTPRPLMITPGKIRELYHTDWVCDGGISAKRPTLFAEGIAKTLAWYRQEEWLPPRRKADKTRPVATLGESAE